jgi:hypothetical protein
LESGVTVVEEIGVTMVAVTAVERDTCSRVGGQLQEGGEAGAAHRTLVQLGQTVAAHAKVATGQKRGGACGRQTHHALMLSALVIGVPVVLPTHRVLLRLHSPAVLSQEKHILEWLGRIEKESRHHDGARVLHGQL